MAGTFKRFASLPVMSVLLLIAFIYYTVQFLVINPSMGFFTGPGLLNTVFFTFLASMSSFCYVLAVLRDPGRVPPSYMPDLEDSRSALHEVKRKVQVLAMVGDVYYILILLYPFKAEWAQLLSFVKLSFCVKTRQEVAAHSIRAQTFQCERYWGSFGILIYLSFEALSKTLIILPAFLGMILLRLS
jgi:hypothetical protein